MQPRRCFSLFGTQDLTAQRHEKSKISDQDHPKGAKNTFEAVYFSGPGRVTGPDLSNLTTFVKNFRSGL